MTGCGLRRDLLAQVPLEQPRIAVDLGCGPGNSTELLIDRFPDASVIGLDSSKDMLRQSRERLPRCTFGKCESTLCERSFPMDTGSPDNNEGVIEALREGRDLAHNLQPRHARGGRNRRMVQRVGVAAFSFRARRVGGRQFSGGIHGGNRLPLSNPH
jgi:hypothetical protein